MNSLHYNAFMFVIFGINTRLKENGRGQFSCPYDKSLQPYKQIKSSEWFTLLFIPIFKWRNNADFVECQSCRTRYPEDVLLDQEKADIVDIAS